MAVPNAQYYVDFAKAWDGNTYNANDITTQTVAVIEEITKKVQACGQAMLWNHIIFSIFYNATDWVSLAINVAQSTTSWAAWFDENQRNYSVCYNATKLKYKTAIQLSM